MAPCGLVEYTDVSEVHTASIMALIMKAVHTSETSVYSNQTTRHYIPEGSTLNTRRRENQKSHMNIFTLFLLWRLLIQCQLPNQPQIGSTFHNDFLVILSQSVLSKGNLFLS
jgi:hypothetical protein